MKLSEKTNLYGLTVRETKLITGKSYQTLDNWSIDQPRLFDVVMRGSRLLKMGGRINE